MGSVQPRFEVRDCAVGAREEWLLPGHGALVAPPVIPPFGCEPVVAVPGVGVHDRAGFGRGLQQRAERVGRGVLEDLEPDAPGALAADLDDDPAQCLLAARTPAPEAFLEAAEEELIDLGATIAARNLWSIIHADSWRRIPS